VTYETAARIEANTNTCGGTTYIPQKVILLLSVDLKLSLF